MNTKRLLLISHNALGKTNNMGKTLETSFCMWEQQNIAQLFFSDEQPDSDACQRFFRISDTAILKSVLTRHSASSIPDIKVNYKQSSEHKHTHMTKLKTSIIKWARYRTPLVYCIRNMLWKMGVWKSEALESWLNEFQPEVVFFASGDYAFSYNIALYIAQSRNIPLIVGCYDDFFINSLKTLNPLYYLNRKNLLKTASRLFAYASTFTGLCEKMTSDYSKLFCKSGHTVFTPTSLHLSSMCERRKSIVYAGNLGYGRAEQLIEIGRSLKSLGLTDYPLIDVYSGEIRNEITEKMSLENGIRFHGRVSPNEVSEIISTSIFVIHTESFDPIFKKRVAYSLSTKIADSLQCGACIFAYGPSDVASIEYLSKNQAAFIVNCIDDLAEGLRTIIESDEKRAVIVQNAQQLAKKNHNLEVNGKQIIDIINSVC